MSRKRSTLAAWVGSIGRIMTIQDIFRKTPLFADLNDAELALIGRAAEELTLAEGDRPIEEGCPHSRLYVITEGHVELRGRSQTGQEATLAVLGPQDTFGENALSAAASPVTAEVVLGPARVMVLRGDALQRLIRVSPDIGIGLLRAAFARIQRLQRMAILHG